MNTTTTATPLLTIRVQGKPVSANRMYKPTRRGGKYLAPDAVAWRDAVFVEVRKAVLSRMVFEASCPLHVVCTFYRVRANADADNLLKLTVDGLKLALRIDDKHFSPVEARKSSDHTQPQGALIEVYAAMPQQAA